MTPSSHGHLHCPLGLLECGVGGLCCVCGMLSWSVMWHAWAVVLPGLVQILTYLANLKTWRASWNYLAEIYITNVGAILTMRAILARSGIKSPSCQDGTPLCRNPWKSYGPNQDGIKSPSCRDGLFMPFFKSWTFGTSISYWNCNTVIFSIPWCPPPAHPHTTTHNQHPTLSPCHQRQPRAGGKPIGTFLPTLPTGSSSILPTQPTKISSR